jgi:hypothetical protein
MTNHADADVLRAFNRAADDILEAISAPDEGVRDALNLLVNAGMHYLDNPDSDLNDAIVASYVIDDDGRGPLDWIKDNT